MTKSVELTDEELLLIQKQLLEELKKCSKQHSEILEELLAIHKKIIFND